MAAARVYMMSHGIKHMCKKQNYKLQITVLFWLSDIYFCIYKFEHASECCHMVTILTRSFCL